MAFSVADWHLLCKETFFSTLQNKHCWSIFFPCKFVAIFYSFLAALCLYISALLRIRKKVITGMLQKTTWTLFSEKQNQIPDQQIFNHIRRTICKTFQQGFGMLCICCLLLLDRQLMCVQLQIQLFCKVKISCFGLQ